MRYRSEAFKRFVLHSRAFFFASSETHPVRDELSGPGTISSIAFSVSLASVIHVLLLFRGFYSATFDESGRTLDAYDWAYRSGSLATVWLPFYKIIVGGALIVAPDLFVTPRVVSFVFGMITLCTIIWLTHVLFNNRTATLVAGVIAAVFPPRVVLTIAPLAEIMFIAVASTAMVFLGRWVYRRKSQDLWLSAIFFAIGSSVRYEGWVFTGVFAIAVLMLLLRRPNDQAPSFGLAAGVIVISLSFIAYWILLHLVENGIAFGFIAGTTGRYALIHGDRDLLLNNPLTQFLLQNASTLNIVGMLSMTRYLHRNASSRMAALIPIFALVLVSLIAVLGKGMPTHGFWRIPVLWSLLLIPFTANWFADRLSSSDRNGKIKTTVTILLLIFLVGLCMNGILTSTEHSAFSKADLATGRFIDSQFSQYPHARKVLIESDIWSYVNVMIASQHPEWFVFNSGFDPVEHKDPIINPESALGVAGLQRMNVAFLIFRRDDYKDYLERNVLITKLEEFGPWSVYSFSSNEQH